MNRFILPTLLSTLRPTLRPTLLSTLLPALLSIVLALALSPRVALAQPLPAVGHSAPAIDFQPPVTGMLADEFSGDTLSDVLWFAAVSEEQTARGGSIEVMGDVCVMTSELTPAGVEGGPVGLISGVGPFAPQSFELSADMMLGPRQGEYGLFLAVSDLLVPGGPPSRAMGVALYHAEHRDPGGAIVTQEAILIADGTSGGLPEWYAIAWPGLFDSLSGWFTVAINYNADTEVMTVAIPELGFSHAGHAVYDQPRAVSLLAGGGGGPDGPVQASQLVVTVDRVHSSFVYASPGGYAASLAPFVLDDDVVYDGSALFGQPATVFLDAAVQADPIVISADQTLVPASGTTSYSVALLTLMQGDVRAPVTVITSLSAQEIEDNIPGVTLDAYVPGLYVAQGHGVDYLVDYAALAEPVLVQLETLVTADTGPGHSLVAKLRGIRAAFDAGDYDLAQERIESMRSQVWAQRGKHVDEALADEILASLNTLERIIVAYLLLPLP